MWVPQILRLVGSLRPPNRLLSLILLLLEIFLTTLYGLWEIWKPKIAFNAQFYQAAYIFILTVYYKT